MSEKQKKSVSAKKKPTKGIRNVLLVPYDNFWPVVDEKDGINLKKNLEKVLPLLKKPQINISWKELRKLSKEERLEKKKSVLKSKEVPNNDLNQHVIIGVNAVTRQLEKYNLCSILLDSAVDPPLLIKHVVTMAAHKKVPVLLVPFLSSVMLEATEFSTIALAFKKTVTESKVNEFYETHKSIVDIANNFPLPITGIKSCEMENSDIILLSNDDEMECEEITYTLEPKKIAVSTNVYLYRNSKNERTFVPRSSKESKIELPIEEDFIAMPSDDEINNDDFKAKARYHNCYKESKKETKESKKNAEKDYYVPLKVKRIHGNPSRTKATKYKLKK